MRAHQNTWWRVSQALNWVKEKMENLDAFIVFWVPAWMLADVQMNGNVSDAHAQWFSCWKIRADDCDIMK